MNEIEEIKQRLDLVELIGQYVALKKAGANYKAVCPFHHDKTPSLMVSPDKQIWKCFGCQKGGSIYDFVMAAEHLEFADALKLLASRAGVTLQPRTAAEYQSRDRKETLYRLNHLVARIYQKVLWERPAGKAALDYLISRGLNEATIRQFGLGFAAPGMKLADLLMKQGFRAGELAEAGHLEQFSNRIIFPILDVLGSVIGFTGRALGQGEPKYLNSPETLLFQKSRVLYGLNQAKGAIKSSDYVVLVEGQMDVLALHQAGVKQAVASSGTAVTEAQLQVLSRYTANFLLAFDNDPAGQLTTRKVIELLLRQDCNNKVVDFGRFKDASELIQNQPQTWRTLHQNAQEGVDWLISQELNRAGNLQFVENKKKVLRALLPVLQLITDPIRLDHSVQRLALATGIRIESVYAALSRVARSNQRSQPGSSNLSPRLTNEEQLLALLLSWPELIGGVRRQLERVAWQSGEADRVAKQLQKLYNEKTLVRTTTNFQARARADLGPVTAGVIDSWLIWVSRYWPELSSETASELIKEKISRLTTRDYEQQKVALAQAISRAQQTGDLESVKQLMVELNQLTKKKPSYDKSGAEKD